MKMQADNTDQQQIPWRWAINDFNVS